MNIVKKVVVFVSISLFSGQLLAESKIVVSSIKPIHWMVDQLVEGVAKSELLMEQGDPHSFALKPSHMRLINKADLIVFGGESLETAMVDVFEKRTHFSIETLDDRIGLLATRDIESFGRANVAQSVKTEDADIEEHEEHDSHAGHNHGELDMHFWLDPKIMAAIALELSDELKAVYPSEKGIIEENLIGLLSSLVDLQINVQMSLADASQANLLVYHDALQYFETAYGLNVLGAVLVDSQRKPGIKTIKRIREQIRQKNITCIISQQDYPLMDTVIEGSDAKKVIVDILGSNLAYDKQYYSNLINRLSQQIKPCLAKS